VLTQDWTQASVLVATAVAFGLLGGWIVLAIVIRRWRGVMLACGLGFLGQPAASGGRHRGRNTMAERDGRQRQLADCHSRLADRRLQPVGRLGHLAARLGARSFCWWRLRVLGLVRSGANPGQPGTSESIPASGGPRASGRQRGPAWAGPGHRDELTSDLELPGEVDPYTSGPPIRRRGSRPALGGGAADHLLAIC